MYESQFENEKHHTKVDQLANYVAYVTALVVKNAIKVTLLHGRPNQPLASHGDHFIESMSSNNQVAIEQPARKIKHYD